MVPSPVRIKAVLTAWHVERGFGFAAPVHGGADVFVHIKAFPEGAAIPQVGDQLDFELEVSPQGKRRAARVRTTRPPTVPPRRLRATARSGRLGYLVIVGFLLIYGVTAWYRPLPIWVPLLYVGMSAVCFLAYANDKAAAVKGGWRIPEASLLALGVVGGWPGAILAQQWLRHKTIKTSFQRVFWTSVVVNVVGFALLSWLTLELRSTGAAGLWPL